MYSINIIRNYSDAVLHEILTISKASLPENWQYPDEADYYSRQLRNEKTLHILLKRNKWPIGYLLAIPHNDAVHDDELRQADPDLGEDPDRLYIETMEIVPEYGRSLAGGRLCMMMLRALVEEAGKRGLYKFSMHARVTTGLNKALRKIYGDMLTQFRTIENWPFYNCEEPTEYIEATYRRSGESTRKSRNEEEPTNYKVITCTGKERY